MIRILSLFLFLSISLQAQFSVSGKIEPHNNLSWILLYKLENGKKVYIENSNVTNGNFKFNFSEDQPAGIYRLYYQPKDNRYVDFIYNKENIVFSFDPENPTDNIHFTTSKENKVYQEYYRQISKEQKKLDSIQVAYFRSTDKNKDTQLAKAYKQQLDVVARTQREFEKRSEGMLAHHFIVASRRHNAKSPFKVPVQYLSDAKQHFFDAIDMKDPVLSNSTFLNEKMMDYVLYLNQAQDPKKQDEFQKKAILDIKNRTQGQYAIQKNFYESLINYYMGQGNLNMLHFVLDNQYKKLPSKYQDRNFIYKVESELRTAVGNKAPNLEWNENGQKKNLYGLSGSDYYIVAFFSSSCPHCQNQMPVFYDFIKNIPNVKVIAVGLEEQKSGWEEMTRNWNGFINILDLKKWDSQRAKLYGVTAIPSFFVLDKNKKIIGKPDNVEELKRMFK